MLYLMLLKTTAIRGVCAAPSGQQMDFLLASTGAYQPFSVPHAFHERHQMAREMRAMNNAGIKTISKGVAKIAT